MAKLSVKGQCVLPDARLIIFDKDGTLIDVHSYWAAMIRYRSQALAEAFSATSRQFLDTVSSGMGLNLETGQLKPEGPIGIKPRPIVIEAVLNALQSVGVSSTADQVGDIFKKVDQKTLEKIDQHIEILPGVKDFIIAAHAAGIKLAIGTSDRTDRAERIMTNLGLADCFDQIVGGDKIQHAKPHPETVLQLMSHFKVTPAQTAVVGDHAVDIEMGRNAGLRATIGVLTGLGTTSDFTQLKCPYAKTFTEMSVS